MYFNEIIYFSSAPTSPIPLQLLATIDLVPLTLDFVFHSSCGFILQRGYRVDFSYAGMCLRGLWVSFHFQKNYCFSVSW